VGHWQWQAIEKPEQQKTQRRHSTYTRNET
jgi:hypothetical protein